MIVTSPIRYSLKCTATQKLLSLVFYLLSFGVFCLLFTAFRVGINLACVEWAPFIVSNLVCVDDQEDVELSEAVAFILALRLLHTYPAAHSPSSPPPEEH